LIVRRFAYVRPRTVRDAVRAIGDGGPEARFLAGGTTLYDLMKLDVERPATVVDVTGLDQLRSFNTSGRRELVFGALVPMSAVADDRRLVREYPALSESMWRAASQQLRNMATVGGNLLQRTRCPYFRGGAPFACNKREPGSGCDALEGVNRSHAVLGGSSSCVAVYPGDWAVALTAFDAKLDVVGSDGERTIPVRELHREPGDTPHIETVLAPDELIVRVRVPTTPLGRASAYHKIRDRESYAFALASAAVALSLNGERVRQARIALGGVATRPWRAEQAERQLTGRRLTREAALAAGEAALAGAQPLAHNAFKIELGAQTVADALMIAKERA
jgi:xanthine dehydrogenase YagS FAD-binding subunit